MLSAVSPIVKLRNWFLISLAFVVAIAFSGCNPSEFKTTAAQVSQMVVMTTTDPKTFNYALSQESPNIFPLTAEGLATENGVTKEIEPALAESWEISDDKLRYVFTLREGLKWSDGNFVGMYGCLFCLPLVCR